MNSTRSTRLAGGTCCALLLISSGLFAAEGVRTWTDKSGAFQVEAKLQKFADGKVVLLKGDGREVTVPVTALSDADQKYLEAMHSGRPNPFAGGTPVAKSAGPASLALLEKDAPAEELPTDGEPIYINIDQPLPPLEPDPLPFEPQFRPFARPIEKLDAYARTSAPIRIDPDGATYALSAFRVGNNTNPETFGRVYLAGTRGTRPKKVLDLPETLLLLDHHFPSGRSLAVLGVDYPSERGGDLVLLDGLAEDKPGVIARWHLPEWQKPGFKPKVEYGRLLNDTTAVVRVNDKLHVWNLQEGKSLWVIDELRAGAKLQLSGGGRYLAIPVAGGCRVVELASGELLGSVSCPSALNPEVDFSPDGTRLGLVAGNQFVVWDVTKGELVAEGTLADHIGKFLGWIENDYLLTEYAGVIDPGLALSLWKYNFSSSDKSQVQGKGVVTVGKSGGVTMLIALPVPHPPVAAVARKLAQGGDDLYVIRPGTEVSLKIEAIDGVDQEVMQKGLAQAVEEAGWKVNPQAPIQLIASIGRGETQELRFRMIGESIRAPGQTASLTPYTASLKVQRGADVLWSRSSRNMVPSFLRMQEGETLQEAVKRYEKPNPEFFTYLDLPPKILKPEVSQTVGRSRIDEGKWLDF